jgi:DNA polymerase-3 subunit gamma/tau
VFDNIIGRSETTRLLSGEIARGTFPASVLIHGERYGGKLSLALEAARVLTCKGQGEWSCGCTSCRQHRLLIHPYLLMAGPRYFGEEIAASADTLLRTRKEAARYLYIRAVRKLTRRLDSVLWEGNEQKLDKVRNEIETLEDALEELYPEYPLPDTAALKKHLSVIEKAARKMAEVLPKDSIPVDQVRAMSYWARTTSTDSAKAVILEEADLMGASTRNALLKILEEPPENTYFFLLTARKGGIMPTILSRVRPYHLPPRSGEEQRQVLEKIFRLEELHYQDLRSYFFAWKGIPLEELRREAKLYLDAAAGEDEWGMDEFGEFLKARGLPQFFLPFLQELQEELRSRAARKTVAAAAGAENGEPDRAGEVSPLSADRINGMIKKAAEAYESYNLSPSLLLESLYYDICEEEVRQ